MGEKWLAAHLLYGLWLIWVIGIWMVWAIDYYYYLKLICCFFLLIMLCNDDVPCDVFCRLSRLLSRLHRNNGWLNRNTILISLSVFPKKSILFETRQLLKWLSYLTFLGSLLFYIITEESSLWRLLIDNRKSIQLICFIVSELYST